MNTRQQRLAVLIDADNSPAAIVEGMLDEIAQYGVASVKRIYGDFTDNRLKSWKSTLLEYGIHPMQQFAYTSGKNATDSAMIIDAMDLLYTENFDGFCIVSSDSDFTRLALRIREAGLIVYGFGERKTPTSFMSACDKFIYIENLRQAVIKDTTPKKEKIKLNLKTDKKLIALLKNAVYDTADDAGWSFLGAIGQNIANKQSSFDPRSYGHFKLGALIKSTDAFEFKERDPFKNSLDVYVRPKRERKKY